jgi:hypothetical protein
MTYAELSTMKTQGFVTNHVIDDVVNNGRAYFTKSGFKKVQVSERELDQIRAWANKEGIQFPSAA